jgi:hypothetical protein
MSSHRYTLQPYNGSSTRHTCPSCNKHKQFCRYIDIETLDYLAENVGRCERITNCGYHLKPKQYFTDNGIISESSHIFYKPVSIAKPTSYIPVAGFKRSLNSYDKNNLVTFLTKNLGSIATNKLIEKYFIGTSDKWPGATIFWQIDLKGKIRTGKIMLYNSDTGKRIKEPYDHITWVHKQLNTREYELKQSFYGEHLLHDKSKPVALVESEKTAIIASAYLPMFNWLAVGNISSLSEAKCRVLSGRNVVLYPDLNAFGLWSKKAKELSSITNFSVSDLLERKATTEERLKGLDLADYLIKFDVTEFHKPIHHAKPKSI